jgi:hypothetical protein
MTMPQTKAFADTEVTVCSEGDFLLLLRSQRSGCGSLDWFREHRQAIMAALDDYGMVFFRGSRPTPGSSRTRSISSSPSATT